MACDSESTEKLNFMSHEGREKSFLVSLLSGSFVISEARFFSASGFSLNSCKVYTKLYGDEGVFAPSV